MEWRELGFAWNPEELGNHRARVRVEAPASAVAVCLPPTRMDLHVPGRAMLAIAPSGQPVECRAVPGEPGAPLALRLAPCAEPGLYHVYTLPYRMEGTYYPSTTYPEAAPGDVDLAGLPVARFEGWEAVAPHHAFAEMDTPADPRGLEALRHRLAGAPFALFCEPRERPITMTRAIPACWLIAGPPDLPARRGEYLPFQLGVWAHSRPLEALQVTFHGPLAAAGVRCYNTRLVDALGASRDLPVSVPAGAVQALWCGLPIPPDAPAGPHTLVARVSDAGETVELPITLTIADQPAGDPGDDDPARLSRLRWLDSRLGDDDTVVPPYEPVRLDGSAAHILGRSVTFGPDGLPAAIASRFEPGVTAIGSAPTQILAAPIAFQALDAAGEPIPLHGPAFAWTARADARADLAWCGASPTLALRLQASIEFDGTLEYRLELRALAPAECADVRLTVPVTPECAAYRMGLGRRGGAADGGFEWRWDLARNQDALWLGAPHAGLQITLKDDRYVRPLNTNFYHQRPLVLPRSWHNEGQGSVRLEENGAGARIVAASGPLRLAPGESLRFDFRLMITPFKPVDTATHFSRRFYHAFEPVETVRQSGANVVNVHHANAINPYINYPFLRPDAMKAYVDEAHAAGIRVKIYYTVRELSTRAPEIRPLMSFGPEILSPGQGGGYSWLQEHLEPTFIPAWFAPNVEDSSVIINGISRWQNHYVEGLDWLARNIGIDGLYLDDVAFDRSAMKRVRRVLARRRPEPIIDLHSANQYNERDGFASSANLYMEHLPFIDRLWFGEYFNYDARPDEWLVEMSGIPFGLPGEMLEKGGNPWRGILFGMTSRLGWSEQSDPRPVWRILDELGAPDARMIGWWSPAVPVRTDCPDIPATVYARPGATLVALASWAPEPVSVRLTIDRHALGLPPGPLTLRAPDSPGFQPAASWPADQPIPVDPGRGLLLFIEPAWQPPNPSGLHPSHGPDGGSPANRPAPLAPLARRGFSPQACR